ncbi:MAG TPA: TIGR02391 family protein [Candidatus Omnitrophica bacterium]|nr:TIGR02391 family protein [Candidatus Omnitrophota bacterium]
MLNIEEGDANMDYEQLKGIYGRLLGLSESLPDQKSNVQSIIAEDYNLIVDEIAEIIEKDLNSYKIPRNQYFGDGSYVKSGSATKIRQLISHLRYAYNLDEKILELGSLINAIENQELKDRCLDLLTARSKFDRVINQATLVLEDSIRQKSGITGKEGVKLVNEAIKDNALDSVLVIDGEPEEQEGLAHICRGIMLSFRNLTHHKLVDKFSREDALKFCGFIDILLKIIQSAKKSK